MSAQDQLDSKIDSQLDTQPSQANARPQWRLPRLSPRALLIWGSLLLVAAYSFFCPAINEPLYQLLAIMPTRDYIDTTRPCTMGAYAGEHEFFPVLDAAKLTMLHGVYFHCNDKQSKGLVVVNPGNAFCLAHMLGCKPFLAILDRGWDLFIFDYEGFGESEGKASYKNLGNDALSAYRFVHDKLKAERIVLYGMSMGTGVSSYVAERAPVAGVIYDSPFVSPERTIKDWFPILNVYPSQMFPKPAYDNGKYLSGKHPPALIINKGCDTVCRPTQGVELAQIAVAPTKTITLPASQHLYVDSADDCAYTTALQKYLDSIRQSALHP